MHLGRRATVGVPSSRCAPHAYFTCILHMFVMCADAPHFTGKKMETRRTAGSLADEKLSWQAEEYSSDPEQPQLTVRQRRASNALMLNIGWKHFRTFRRGAVLVFLRLFQYLSSSALERSN